jgi:hypothetical protein
MYFTIEEEVLHPETREVVLMKNATYRMEELSALKSIVGFDHFKSTVIYAESLEDAIRISWVTY